MLAAAATAAAGTFSIAPVRLELQGAQRTAVITVHNDDAAPLLIQVSTLNWTQPEGKETYSATHDLLATPPIFSLPPNGEQIVRVALRREPDAARELDYRLLLAEVPQPPERNFTGLRVALQLSIPVFVASTVAGAAALNWHATWREDGKLEVSAANAGQSHLQVSDFSLHIAGSEQSVARPGDPLCVARQQRKLEDRRHRLASPTLPPSACMARVTRGNSRPMSRPRTPKRGAVRCGPDPKSSLRRYNLVWALWLLGCASVTAQSVPPPLDAGYREAVMNVTVNARRRARH